MLRDLSQTDPFAAVFGSQRSSNPNRRRLRIVAEPGLTVLLRYNWDSSISSLASGSRTLGRELSFRTQHTDERRAVASALKQLERKHKGEDKYDWLVVSVTPEPTVSNDE